MLEEEELTIEEIDYDIDDEPILNAHHHLHQQQRERERERGQEQVQVQEQEQQRFCTRYTPKQPRTNENHLYRICLPPDNNITNQITNELFQVTSNLRTKQPQQQRNNSLFYNNVWKIAQGFDINNKLEETDYELDDVTRTKVFQKRFKKPINDINPELGAYFSLDSENKENPPKPYKVTKKKTKQRSIPLIETNNLQKRNPNNKKKLIATTTTTTTTTITPLSSPQRICQPKHQFITPTKPSLNKAEKKIFLIESSTGLVADATRFATELNGSNSSELLYPENENEVIQIPTNRDNGDKTAIIRMYNIKASEKNTIEHKHNGFYSENELQTYQLKQQREQADQQVISISQESSSNNDGVQILSQSSIDNLKNTGKKSVRWAPKLEW
ncbi:hypothetical protein KGF56_000069 [Candida oxycetoniae]|uniref:Uncharacterized protein n=1 Tax=Candida oxycetoniae TaxID=497107 RepID=A0AAI9T262_9ASCO|nr:uncharacterized protein KGF56_000069 [Candida oxycetoniae]KAI3407082.2 hypothetical protein KGF56_000069 [Candida oxycetoniae]